MPKAMLIDTSVCVGCKGCQTACKEWWNLPAASTKQTGKYENPGDLAFNTYTRVRFNEYESGGKMRWLFLNWGCLHCTQAACVDVCPTHALKRNGDGLVTLNRDQCNGCGYCTQVCPFNIPRMETTNLLTGEAKASKCSFCDDRVANGMAPACAKACPTAAIQFGDRTAMLASAKARVGVLKERGYAEARVYGENELGGLGRMYVLTAPAPAFGLPETPEYPGLLNVWQNWTQPFGYATTALTAIALGINWFFTRRNRLNHVEPVKEA